MIVILIMQVLAGAAAVGGSSDWISLSPNLDRGGGGGGAVHGAVGGGRELRSSLNLAAVSSPNLSLTISKSQSKIVDKRDKDKKDKDKKDKEKKQ